MESRYRESSNERFLDFMRTSKLFSRDSAVQEHLKEIGLKVLELEENVSNRRLHDEEVNLAIVSVVQAIDNLQALAHVGAGSEQPFAGGFALTTSTSLQLAMAGSIDNNGTTLLSRPRRAWLVPAVISAESILSTLEQQTKGKKAKWSPPKDVLLLAGSHTLLVLVQEVFNEEGDANPGGTHFDILFFDSDSKIFDGVTKIIASFIRKAARCLGWSDHREIFDLPRVKSRMNTVTVPQQPGGGWQCGYHMIVNAWIISMGLHPVQEATYTDMMYRKIVQLARAATTGILDWRTLAEWLTIRNLIEEKPSTKYRQLVTSTRPFARLPKMRLGKESK